MISEIEPAIWWRLDIASDAQKMISSVLHITQRVQAMISVALHITRSVQNIRPPIQRAIPINSSPKARNLARVREALAGISLGNEGPVFLS